MPNLGWWLQRIAINKLESRGFRASSLSTYDFATLYTTLSHNLIKDKLVDVIIERFFHMEGSIYIACIDRHAFFTSYAVRNYNSWFVRMREDVSYLLDNFYIRFGSEFI